MEKDVLRLQEKALLPHKYLNITYYTILTMESTKFKADPYNFSNQLLTKTDIIDILTVYKYFVNIVDFSYNYTIIDNRFVFF